MIKKTITYTDYDNNTRTEDFYFGLNKAELIEMEIGVDGSLKDRLTRIVNENNPGRIMETFKTILLKSYGKKSDDGKRFIKSKEITDEFLQTEAYSNLFMELVTDANVATDFINGILPKDVLDEINNNPEVKKEILKLQQSNQSEN